MAEKKRGRPSTGKAMTEAERARKYRETRRAKIQAIGGQQLKIVLDRDAVDALVVCIGAHSGLTAGQLVGSLLQREAERIASLK